MLATERFKFCEWCNKKFYCPYGFGLKQWTLKRFCSLKCFGKADGLRRTGMAENLHARWTENVGYYGVHDWITKHFGQPTECEVCGLNDPKRKYHWANLSGEYKRERSDFKRMCVSCHRNYDYAKRKLNGWSLKYEACLICKTTRIKYHGNGLCRKCYHAKRNGKSSLQVNARE